MNVDEGEGGINIWRDVLRHHFPVSILQNLGHVLGACVWFRPHNLEAAWRTKEPPSGFPIRKDSEPLDSSCPPGALGKRQRWVVIRCFDRPSGFDGPWRASAKLEGSLS